LSRKGKYFLATLLIAAVFSLAVFAFMEKKAVNRAVENGYEATDIALGVGRDETEVNLSWYTPETSVPGVIQIAEKSFMKGSEFPVDRAKTVKALLSSASPGFSSHKGTVTGLDSSAEYVYRLGDGKGKWTGPFTFQTGRGDAFTFLFVSDPQIGASGDSASDAAGWEDTLKKAYRSFPDTSFVICAGDQVDDPYNEEQYADYFSPGRLKQIPFATAVGNHDASELYRYHFHVPNESSSGRTSAGGDYWFAYGDALFMVLNTNKKDGEGKAAVRNVGEHIAFMKETLEKNQKAKWKFVVFHHSIYSAANHSQDRDIIRLRRDLVPALDALGIDVVFMGHDHSYVRTFPMKGNQPLPVQRTDGRGRVVDPPGTVYFTANSASGSKYYDLVRGENEDYAAAKSQLYAPAFSVARVTPETFEIGTFRTDTMEVIDSYAIVKK